MTAQNMLTKLIAYVAPEHGPATPEMAIKIATLFNDSFEPEDWAHTMAFVVREAPDEVIERMYKSMKEKIA